MFLISIPQIQLVILTMDFAPGVSREVTSLTGHSKGAPRLLVTQDHRPITVDKVCSKNEAQVFVLGCN